MELLVMFISASWFTLALGCLIRAFSDEKEWLAIFYSLWSGLALVIFTLSVIEFVSNNVMV